MSQNLHNGKLENLYNNVLQLCNIIEHSSLISGYSLLDTGLTLVPGVVYHKLCHFQKYPTRNLHSSFFRQLVLIANPRISHDGLCTKQQHFAKH